MLTPSLQLHNVDGVIVGEFWDCLRLDPRPVSELREAYERHLQAKGRPEVVVDLSGVGFAGSASLGHLVALHRRARQSGGCMVLCNVDPTVHEVLRASKLGALFDMASDRAAALAAVDKLRDTDMRAGAAEQAGLLPREKPTASGTAGTPPLRLRRRNPDPA